MDGNAGSADPVALQNADVLMDSPLGDCSRRCRIARDVIRQEAEAVAALADRLDHRFDKAVELLLRMHGRVIVTGIGKSGLIGQKIAATLTSTGTPASFLHPVEAGHGDLGVVNAGDVVLAISRSGASEEIGDLLPAFKRLGAPIILITGQLDGELARRADVVLDASVEREAEPHNLVPSCSTTAALAIGDALAITLLSERGFTPEEFALLHPKGALGRRLLLTVGDLMHSGEQVPLVPVGATFRDVLVEMTRKRLGTTGVVDAEGKLVGIFTDGDLRRQTEMQTDLYSKTAGQIMTKNPKTIAASELAVTAVAQMEDFKITTLFVVYNDGRPKGIIHLHDILSTGTL